MGTGVKVGKAMQGDVPSDLPLLTSRYIHRSLSTCHFNWSGIQYCHGDGIQSKTKRFFHYKYR